MKPNNFNGERYFTTSEICQKLGFNVSARFIENELGIQADCKTKTAVMWKASNFNAICYELSQWVWGVGMDFINSEETKEC